MEPSLALQAAIRGRIVAASAVTALVPATSVKDANGAPSVFPCVLIGEAQTVPDDGISRNRHEVIFDLHVWQKEAGLVGAKQIAGAIRGALADSRWSVPGLHVADLHVLSSRFMRDPSGLHSHGVLTLQARVMEVA